MLSVQDVKDLHEMVITQFPTPVTRGKIVDSNIESVLNKVNYQEDVYKKAAVLFEGFIRGHIFADGNKRTALLVTFVFLKKNNITLDLKKKDIIIDLIIMVAVFGEQSYDKILKLIELITGMLKSYSEESAPICEHNWEYDLIHFEGDTDFYITFICENCRKKGISETYNTLNIEVMEDE